MTKRYYLIIYISGLGAEGEREFLLLGRKASDRRKSDSDSTLAVLKVAK